MDICTIDCERLALNQEVSGSPKCTEIKKNSFFDICHVSNFKTEFCSLKSDALYSTKQSDNLCLRCQELLGSFHCYLNILDFSKNLFFHLCNMRVITTNCKIAQTIKNFFYCGLICFWLNCTE